MRLALSAALLLGTTLLGALPTLAQDGYIETDLVSDIQGRAQQHDPNLVNPWGIVPGPTGVFWVSDEETGKSTLYQPDGAIVPLVVTIPGGDPTGVVLASLDDAAFEFQSGDSMARAIFIFVTLNGTVAAWHSAESANAVQVADVENAVYTGAAIAGLSSNPRLYAANFAGRRIDVFDRSFDLTTVSGSFQDPNLPDGYSPFNIAEINGQLYVAYAVVASGGEEEPGPGLGIISVFDTQGNFIKRFATGGALNAPWAIVRAPSGFGEFAGELLVGNFGDGRINAFNPLTGAVLGALENPSGDAIELEGLWGLHFGRGNASNRLYFAAGIDDETHGLFGYLAPERVLVCDNDSRGVGFWRHQCGGPHGDDDGDGHGHGKGKDKDKDKGDKGDKKDKDDHDKPGKRKGHGRLDGRDDHDRPKRPFVSADSLESLFRCIRETSEAFGSGGCFTADCALLRDHGRMSARDRAAQAFLTLLLNRCSGLVCDDALVRCGSEGPRTLGELIARIDGGLCDVQGDDGFNRITRLVTCVIDESDRDDHADDHGDDDDDCDDDDVRAAGGASDEVLQIKPLSGNPVQLASGTAVRFQLSTAAPATVRFRIVDAAGRLIAEPLRQQAVSGSIEVRWDGRDLRGGLVPPGNYFYQAISPTAVARGRFVIMR